MDPQNQDPSQLEANFSTLVLSIASSAMMALGLAPNPNTEKVEKDLTVAQFNIDLLLLLQDKTKNNLTEEESQFIENVIKDLQMKYVQASSGEPGEASASTSDSQSSSESSPES